jgi:hypothetical protein
MRVMQKPTARRLALSSQVLRVLSGLALEHVRGGVPYETTALTDGNNGCQSEATGCHTGWTACGTC